ncbi:MarR family winged helix-turn-helix transcriptional regulator [Alicyclobacillus fructus]|uniref:MarR family winged helix-turn-helix transcriptional regulator n=2 Tax=Alicyclobacillus fructus TaxID=2816082 RepID=UPI002E2E80DE|nr:MarR family transcriptional regulator [Alicyclobacillus fructus]
MGKKMKTELIEGGAAKPGEMREEPLARTLAVTTYLLVHSAFLQPVRSLTPGQYVLMDLVRRKIATRTMDLADHLGVSPSAVTIMLSRMEKRGWIQRTEDRNDRRVVHVALTEQGQMELTRVEQVLSLIIQRCTRDNSDYRSLERALRALQETLVVHLRTSGPVSGQIE